MLNWIGSPKALDTLHVQATLILSTTALTEARSRYGFRWLVTKNESLSNTGDTRPWCGRC
jgi:hypothetical protein